MRIGTIVTKQYLMYLLTAFSLIACGGGDPGVTPPTPTPDPPGPRLNTQTVGVNVQLPATLSIPKNSLKLETALGEIPVAADGSSQAEIFEQGPQFAQVLNANDNPILMGWAKPGNPGFSINTTAQVFMYFNLGAYLTTSDLQKAIMDELAKSSDLKPLEDAISQALATDPNSMGADNPQISAAIKVVHDKLLSYPTLQSTQPSIQPRSVKIDPNAPKSGIEMLQGDGQQIKIRNSYRRRAKVFLDRVAFIDQNSARQDLGAAAARGAANDVSPILTTTSVYGSIADFILASVPGTDASGKYAWQPVDSDPILLQIAPDTALGSVYSVRAVGAGGITGDHSPLTADQEKAQQDLTKKTIVVDFVLPFITGVAMPAAGNTVKTLKDNALAWTVLTDVINLVPQSIWDKASAGDFKGSVNALISAFLNPAAYGASNTMKTRMIELAAVLIAKGRSAAVIDRVAKMFTGKIGKVIDILDQVLVVMDSSAQMLDIVNSSQVETWEVTVKKGKLRLMPPEQTITKYDVAGIEEKIEGAESYTGLQFKVSTTGKYGHLYANGKKQTGEFILNHTLIGMGYAADTPLAAADANGKRQDIIMVEAFGFDGNVKTSLGIGTAIINIEDASLDATPRSVTASAGPGKLASTSFNVISRSGTPSFSVSSGGPLGVVLNGSGTLKNGESRVVRLQALCPNVETKDGGSITTRGSLTVNGTSAGGKSLPGINIAATLTCGTRKAKSWGDPHLVTFDGRAYDFQATGDFVLTHSTTDNFQVQVRYRSLGGGNISYNDAIAAQVGSDVVEVYSTPATNPKVFINKVLLDTSSTLSRDLTGGAFSVSGNQVNIVWTDGSNLSLNTGSNLFYSVDFSVPAERSGQLEGLLGDADGDATNDIHIKGGAVIANPSQKDLYLKYRQSWRIPFGTSDSLFSQGTDLYDPFYPVNVISLDDLDPAEVEKAKQICLERGILDTELFRLCVFDVAISGDPKFADYALGLDPNVLRVLVNPQFSFVPLGQANRNVNLGAIVTGTQNRTVTWTTTGGSLQSNNNLTTVTVPDIEGTYTVTATLNENQSILGSARILVAPSSYAVWTGKAGTNNWTDAKNWFNGVVPGANSIVLIDAQNTTVTHSGGTDTIAGLIAKTSVAVSGGTLHITGAASITNLSLAGGNLETDGILTLTGQNAFSGGTLGGTGKFVNQGEFDLTPGNYKYLSTTLENAGTIKVQDTFYPGSPNGLVKNAGTLEFVNDADIGQSGGFTLNLENTGTILKSGGGDVTQLDAVLTNTGTLETKNGTLRLRFGTLSGGIYNVSAGAILDLDNDLTFQGTLTGNAAGTILVSNTTLRIPDGLVAHLNFTGTGFTFSGGTIAGPGKLVNDANNTLNIIGGNYKYLSTTLENLGTIKVSDSFYPGSANGAVKNAGTLEFVNDADIGQSGGFTLNLENTGTILKSGGTDVTQLDANLTNSSLIDTKIGTLRLRFGTLNGGTYNVTAGATLELNNDLSLQGTLNGNITGALNASNLTLHVPTSQTAHLNFTGNGIVFSGGSIVGPGTLVNDGQMTFTAGNYKYLSTTLENTGTIKVSDPFYPGSSSGLLKNAGTLEFVNDSGVGTSGGFVLSINNTGTLLKSGGIGTSTIDADVTNTGTITEQSGHFSFPRGLH
jgi:von Willebrand factor type D domain